MTDKKKTSKKVIKKEVAPKAKKAKEPTVKENKTKEVVKPVVKRDNSMLKFLATVVISSVVTASIVITTPFWMDKLLPVERQPAFLKKALMPITNVKVIKTKPLSNNIEKLLDDADKSFVNKLSDLENRVDSKISKLNNDVQYVVNKNREIDADLSKRTIQNKMFLVSFYNMYAKAIIGARYEHELDLMQMSSEKIDVEFPWVESYKSTPPSSIMNLGKRVDDNYSVIVEEYIRKNEKGLKQKFLISLNSLFRLDAPLSKLENGSFKYNLTDFIKATKSKNTCRAMFIGKKLSEQSEWFKNNVANELEARYRVDSELNKLKQSIEKEIYSKEKEVLQKEEIKKIIIEEGMGV